MLLRRVIEHVKAQNWTAVALDFVIVVVGVFIGIQVSNWNEVRADRKLERGYAVRLLGDLARSKTHIEGVNAQMVKAADDSLLLLESLKTCDFPEDKRETLAFAASALGKVDFALLDTTVIDEMKATGKAGLFRSIELREQLSALVQAVQYQASVRPQLDARTVPFVNVIRGAIQVNPPGPEASFSRNMQWDYLVLDPDESCGNDDVNDAIFVVREATFIVVSWNQSIIELINETAAAIRAEADDRGWEIMQ